MPKRRCAVIQSAADLVGLSEHDRAEVAKAADLIRRSSAAEAAGAPRPEALVALYSDVYLDSGDVA